MLVLTRRSGKAVSIGDAITVTVLAVEGGKVSIGIDAPSDVPIMRSELGPQRPDGPAGRPPATA